MERYFLSVHPLSGREKGDEAVADTYVTLKDLEARHSDISYQRLNRAVRALKSAGLIDPWRGEKNELRIEEQHALLVARLVELMRRDYGIEKAVAFLRAQVAQEQVKKLQESYRELEKENARLRAQLAALSKTEIDMHAE